MKKLLVKQRRLKNAIIVMEGLNAKEEELKHNRTFAKWEMSILYNFLKAKTKVYE